MTDASGDGFSQDFRVFSYTTPTGGHATIPVVGLGNLQGTTAPGGVLNLVFGATNAYSKITGDVHGGGGHAPLESIQNSQLINAGASNSLSGVGGNVVESFLLSPFDLVDGGRINLTAGRECPDSRLDRCGYPDQPPRTSAGTKHAG